MSDFYQQQVTMYMMRREQRRRAQQAGAGDENPQPAPQPGLLARLRRPAIESEPEPERSPRRRQAGLAESG